jgi:hypothetical protein
MEDFLNSKGLCRVCREERTAVHAEIAPGQQIFVCEKCLETTLQNFIWICLHCGTVYIRPKSLVLKHLKDPALRQAYARCEGVQIVQGIDRCMECEPEAILEFVASARGEGSEGHC